MKIGSNGATNSTQAISTPSALTIASFCVVSVLERAKRCIGSMTLESLLTVAAKGCLFGLYAAYREYRKAHPGMTLAERLGRYVGLLLWRLRRGKARRSG